MTDVPGRLASALADRYRIERELGEGGMATVYLAHDLRHDRPVALKLLRPELSAILGAERFLAEIKTTANLQHPHILSLFDSGEADGLVWYVMPYVEGESLRDRLTREHQLPVDEAVRIAAEVADALAYAHQHGVIHRDIKPENILLHGGHAQVADFGIALAAARSEGGTRMTETGMSLGTPQYMSPEQAMGEREITPRSDVYALGCVLYEMLAGEPPFTGPTAQAIIARVLTEEPRSLTLQRRTVPPHVETAVQMALAKLPADRFATAAAFAQALANPAFRTTSARIPRPAAGPSRRPAATVVLAAIAVVALALAAWGWLRARGAADRQPSWQYVGLGDSATVALDAPAMALSPDGNALVFKDSHQNGQLWVKRRGELDPAPIPGTERAQNPVFSPDGEWVAFVADGHLKKVRASGGPTTTLADSVAIGYGGAAWLDDGTLIYVTPNLGELRRIPAAGGAITVVLPDSVLQRTGVVGGGIGQPVPLPGSRGVLFQLCTAGCVTMSIQALDLRTGKVKALLENVAQAWYLPGGRLLYVRRDGVALAAPFDLRRLEITGEAIPVLEGVEVSGTGGFAMLAWSPTGSLVYFRGAGGTTDNAAVRVSRSGTLAPIDTAWHGQFNSLALAPDGRRLAVSIGSGNGVNIWVKQLDRGPATRLTFGNRDRRPVWSPDGRLVAFIRDTANSSVIYAHPADGSGPDRLLARIGRMVQEVGWSPDGRWLVLRTDNTQAGAGDLVGVRVGADSTAVPLVATAFSELHPAVSPDGRWLAYTSDESGTNEVYVRPFPDTKNGRWQVSNGGGSEPVWGPSGRELFYGTPGGHLATSEVRATASTFAVGRTTTLFDVSGAVIDAFHQSYAVEPGGRSFVVFVPRQLAVRGRNPQVVWVDHWFTDLEAKLRR
jgi:serine/threonine-protein kinase